MVSAHQWESSGVLMVTSLSSAAAAACSQTHHASAASVRLSVTSPFWKVSSAFQMAPSSLELLRMFLMVSTGSAVAAVTAKVWFHTAAAVRLTVTSSLLLVSPSSPVSSPF